ncbi:MAG TPA: peptidyl-prolyl cis-trans isomerase, partial [Pyrinomonadaceae bacterium]
AQVKATEIESRLKKDGEVVSEDTFANVAKGESQNPATAVLGGKLSAPVRENPNKPDDPYQRLLKMKPGEVTEPIPYTIPGTNQKRIYILRRGDEVPKSFDDAKKELDVSLRNRRAYAAATDLASKISDELKQNKDPQKTASDFASQANMSVADMVRETPYVKPGDNVDKIGVSQQFEDGIKDLNNPQDVGDKTPVPEGFAIPMLIDQKPPRDADFDEVKAQIVEVVKLEKARAQVQDIANQIASGSANADALAALATSKGLKAQDQKSFILGTPLGQGPSATTNDALEETIFGMKTGDITKTPIQLGDNWVIVGVKNRQDASMDDYAKQRDDLTEQMLQQKRNSVFTDYLSATKQKMETDGKIVLYPDVIAKVDVPDQQPGEEQQ